MLMMACVCSNWFRCVWCNSSPSTPISAISLNMVANLKVVAEMILFTWSVVGIIGVCKFHLKRGFSHWISLALVYHSYASANEHFDEFESFEYPIACFTSFGLFRSATLLSCLSRCRKALMVFCAFPSIVALAMVLSICSWYGVSCWGRRIASALSSVVVILGVGWLDWFSIPAWGVGDPGFKSQRPHQTQFCLIVQKQARFSNVIKNLSEF